MICLTFDSDHMSEKRMEAFLNKWDIPGKGTFFLHKYYPLYAEKSFRHEACPHPLVENLSSWMWDFTKLLDYFPERPKGVRTHSCVSSHMISIELNNFGMKYSSNVEHLYNARLRPYRNPWGLWEMPIYYMDNMDFWFSKNWEGVDHCSFDSKIIDIALANEDYLFIFDFHPLHIELNTRTHQDYIRVKDRVFDEEKSLAELSYTTGRGTQVFFMELCQRMRDAGVKSYTCSEALAHFNKYDEKNISTQENY